jgi:hypothetical protein
VARRKHNFLTRPRPLLNLINRSPAAIAIGRLFQPRGKALTILESFESPRLPEDHPLIRLAKAMRREHEQELESAPAVPRCRRKSRKRNKGAGGRKRKLTPEILEQATAVYLEYLKRDGGPIKQEVALAVLRNWFKKANIPCPSDSTIRVRIIYPATAVLKLPDDEF